MRNEFENRENGGRVKWLQLNMKDVVSGKKTIAFTYDPYAPIDFLMTALTNVSGYLESMGEIKDIHRDYTKYNNFQIDYHKLQNLKARAEEDAKVPYLVCFFTDYCIVWDLTDIDLEERKYTTLCTSTTAENYNKGSREKEEVWLDKSEALWTRKLS